MTSNPVTNGASAQLRPRRSVLYMPAANERALEKAKTISADAIIFDLEDAVAPDAKPDARARAVAAVQSGEYGNRELTIRCNGLDTEWGADDIAAAGAASPSAVVIPKVDTVEQVDAVSAQLDAAGASVDTMIWPMIETPTAMFNVRSIAAHPRVAVLVMGTNDLAKELRSPIVTGRHPLVAHLATALLAAREAGKVILDGVYNDVKNPDGFAAECQQGMEMGFDGKTLIHRCMGAGCRRDRVRRAGHRGVRRGSRRRKGRGHGRWSHDRKSARRQRPASTRYGCGNYRTAVGQGLRNGRLPIWSHSLWDAPAPVGCGRPLRQSVRASRIWSKATSA